MPTKSRAISRPTHKTVQGRVVYDRPKHEFSSKDALRIIRHLPPPKTVFEMGDEVAAIVLLVLGIFRGIIQLLGPFQAFDPLYATFQSMVTNIWAFIRDNTSVPEDIEGPVFLVKRKTSIL